MSIIKRIISRRPVVRPAQAVDAHPNFWMYQ